MTPSRSRFIDVRRLRYHLREWGDADADAAHTLIMLHGWMDVSASFQFVVDALESRLARRCAGLAGIWAKRSRPGRLLLVPGLPGGSRIHSGRSGRDSSRRWLVGHSMGGNVALMYAGARPQRVRAVVNLEGFGLRPTRARAGARDATRSGSTN